MIFTLISSFYSPTEVRAMLEITIGVFEDPDVEDLDEKLVLMDIEEFPEDPND